MRAIDYVEGIKNLANIYWGETGAALGISATFTGASRDAGSAQGDPCPFTSFNAFVSTDQAGTLRIEASIDGATWRRATADAAVAANVGLFLSVPVTARFHRVVMVNGGVAQTFLLVTSSYTAA